MVAHYIDLNPEVLAAAPGKGPVPAEYMFIGACPSPSRPKERKNEPFGSKSWSIVQNIIKGRSVYITNLVKEPWPSTRKLPVKLIRYYYPSLLEEIRLVSPKRILCLGAEAARVFCPGYDELREDHGTLFWNPDLGCYVVPTWHFSAVARQPLLKKFLARDLERFFELEDPSPPDYIVRKVFPKHFPKNADVYMDLEWDFEGDDRITKVGWAVNDEIHAYILRDPTKEQLLELRERLKEANVTLVGHNFTSDLTRLNRSTSKPWSFRCRDTMVRAHIDGEEFLSLKHLTTYLTDRPGSRAFGGPEDDAYCAEDVLSTRDVEQYQRVSREDPYILDVLFDLIPWIARMQTNGVYIRRDLMEGLLKEQRKKVAKAEKKMKQWADINWDAPAQVGEALVENGVKLVERTKKTGQYSTSSKVLEPIRENYPIVNDLLTLAEEQKYVEFYESWNQFSADDWWFLNPTLKMLGTRTGRFSMSDPNLAQVPRVGPAKTLFWSRWWKQGGKIGLMDLSQAELRVVALLANDQEMIDALNGDDFHTDVASSIYGVDPSDITEAQRKKSKGVTFGLLYGGSDSGLSYNTGAPVREVAKIKAKILGRFKKLAAWIQAEIKKGIRLKFSETLLGRRRSMLELITEEGEDSAARKIVNTPVQATASDIILIIVREAMKLVIKKDMKSRWCFGIYDAGYFDIYPGEEKQLAQCLQRGFESVKRSPLGDLPLYHELPFIGELIVGETWAACEKTNENYNPIEKFELSTHGVVGR